MEACFQLLRRNPPCTSKASETFLSFSFILIKSLLNAAAAEAYACYTSSNTTLTFYYDSQRSSRTGTTYDLNTGTTHPGWYTDGTNANVTKVVFNSSFADARPTTTYYWFYKMEKLQSITGMSYLNTSEVTYMLNMFYYCSNLTSVDVSHLNTSKVISMYGMFGFCKNLTSLDLSNWNTSTVNSMGYMFCFCRNLQTIYVGSGWSTDAVTNSGSMFTMCTSLVGGQGTTYDTNHIDATYAHIDGGTSNPGYFTAATEAYACYTPSNKTLTFYYDTQRASRTGTTYDLNTDNLPEWVNDHNAIVLKVVFDRLFANARPTSTCGWFLDMQYLQTITDMNYLNTSEVTNMSSMFALCPKLTSLDLSSFNTSKVIDVTGMFNGCNGLTSLDLSSFNTSKVTYMTFMFYNCTNLRTIYVGDGWSTAAVGLYSDDIFNGCTSLVGGMGTTYDENHVDKAYAHIDGGPSNPGYFTRDPNSPEAYACYTPSNTTLTFYYDTQRSSRTGTTYDLNTGANITGWESDGTNASVTKVVFDPSFAGARPTTTYDWFYDMTNLQSITGMSYLNTSEVTNMNWMFNSCSKLTSIDLSGFNTSKVTDMRFMFYNCTGLTSLDLSSFNTSNVTNMFNMFGGCSGLRTIYVGNGWSTAAVTESSDMFFYCISLVGGQGTAYSSSNPRNKTYAHIDGGPSNPGYFTAKNAGLRGDVNGDGSVNISDVTALIDYLLSGNASGINLSGADCNQDSSVNISDVTALIDYLLSNHW